MPKKTAGEPARVLVADTLEDVGLRLLDEGGLSVTVDVGRGEDELASMLCDYDALIVRSATKVTARMLSETERLKLIARAGVGVDNVDVDAASRKGIVVMNTPWGNITSAAEHAIALMAALARQIPDAHASMRAGKWDKKRFMGVELAGKVLGVIGMGKVGQIVARAAKGLGMRVMVYDPFLPERRARELDVSPADLDTVLAQSDFLTIHTPLTEKTRGLINRETLARMKPTARLINCARGGIVDEAALVQALRDGKIAGAALDVFEKEPLPPDSPLRSAPNIILTPHLGASTVEAQLKVAEQIARQVVAFFREGKIINAVNVSVTLTPEMEPFADLARILGRFLSQLLDAPPSHVTCQARGKLAGEDIQALTVSALQGLLMNWHDEAVNMVNAPYVAQERGIVVTEEKTPESPNYSSLLRLEVETPAGVHSVAGTVFEGRQSRLVEVDGFEMDMRPNGLMLVLFYPDRPGMVGRFGTILGDANINIAGMDVGRKEKRGRACICLSVDDPVPPEVLERIRECTGPGGEAHLVEM